MLIRIISGTLRYSFWLLAAAIVLDEMDEQAKPAIPALKKALVNQPNKYIVRVANRALNELLGTNNVVR